MVAGDRASKAPGQIMKDLHPAGMVHRDGAPTVSCRGPALARDGGNDTRRSPTAISRKQLFSVPTYHIVACLRVMNGNQPQKETWRKPLSSRWGPWWGRAHRAGGMGSEAAAAICNIRPTMSIWAIRHHRLQHIVELQLMIQHDKLMTRLRSRDRCHEMGGEASLGISGRDAARRCALCFH